MKRCPTTCPFVPTPSWTELTDRERELYELGRISGRGDRWADGYAAGLADGWRQADAFAASTHAHAYRIVQGLAKVEPHEVAKLQRENRWLRSRLEGGLYKPSPAPVRRGDAA